MANLEHADRIDVPLLVKLTQLPMLVPVLLLLVIPADIQAELSNLMIAALAGLAAIGLLMLFKLRKPLLAFDDAQVEFQAPTLLGRRVRLRLDEIDAVAEAPAQVSFGGPAVRAQAGGAREFRFRTKSSEVHVLRPGLSKSLTESMRMLIERRLRGTGIAISLGADRGDDEVGSGQDAHSKLDFVVLFALLSAFMLFTLEYFFLAEEYYAGSVPWPQIVFSAVVASALLVAGSRKYTSSSEGVAKVALVALVTTGLLTYALLPRINQWTDEQGLMTIEFTLDDDRVWRASDPDVPTFAFGGQGEYWEQFQPGARKEFDLRFGGLGFWQINMQRLYADQKEFYASN